MKRNKPNAKKRKKKRPKPYRYQRQGIKKINEFYGRVLLADDMGLGKSCQALLYRKWFLPNGKIVVICPASLKWNWANEIKLWLGKQSTILSKKKPNLEEKEKFRDHKIVIINYDVLGDHKKRHSWTTWLRSIKPDLLIVDEVHNIKNPLAQRSKSVRNLCRKVKKKIMISGTPMTNNPPELWSVLNMLMPDLFPSYRAFASRYAYPEWGPWGMRYKGARRLKELHRLLKNVCMIRRLQKDVLKDLPPKTRTVVPIELNSKEFKQYKMAENDFRNWLTKNHPTKANKKTRAAERLVKFGYLRRLIAQLKLPYIKKWIDDFLEETDQKLILFGVHKFVVRGLNDMYPNISTRIDGSVKGEDRQHAINSFNRNKRIRIMFGNITAAGVGWNGTAATTCAFAELDWVPALHLQAAKRIHRIGQEEPTFENYLIAKGTVDEKLCQVNQEKQITLDKALDGGGVEDGLNIFDLLEESILGD